MVEWLFWMALVGRLEASVERVMFDLTILLALPTLLLAVLLLGGSTLTWGILRARMWQQAYPWWGLKPAARLRFVLLHAFYFSIGATIYTIWGLLITFSSPGRPANFSVSGFVGAWVGAAFIGALLMVPPRAIAYVLHVVRRRRAASNSSTQSR